MEPLRSPLAARLAPRPSLRLRLQLGAALGLAAALLAAWLALGAVLAGAAERGFDARLDAVALALLAGVSRDDETGAVELEATPADPRFERPHSGWYWEVSEEGGELVEGSRSLFGGRIVLGAPGAGSSATGPAGEALRVDERRFSAPGGGGGLVLRVAGPMAELRDAVRASRGTLTRLLALLGAALLLAAFLQVAVGLRPLDELRRDLAAIRAGRARRLPPARHAEVQPLVAELNTLLDHDEALVERSRRHAGNLAHALQTPLAALSNLAAEPGRDPDGQLAQAVERMRAQVSHELRRARLAASSGVLGARAPVAAVLDDLALVLRGAHRDRGIALEVAAPDGLVFAGDRADLEEMAGNLMDNAMKWGRRAVAARARREGDGLVLEVADDGPGLPPGGAAAAIGRGRRLDETVPGHGLGLPIVLETAEAYGGRLELLPAGPEGGLLARLHLPAAPG